LNGEPARAAHLENLNGEPAARFLAALRDRLQEPAEL
jgi:hypothetical protein